MKKILIFSIFALVSITATAAVDDHSTVAVKLNYPNNSTTFTESTSVASSDYRKLGMNQNQQDDAPSALGLVGFALLLGFLGFRMENSMQ